MNNASFPDGERGFCSMRGIGGPDAPEAFTCGNFFEFLLQKCEISR